jgi:FkbM family methyltransferase
VLKSNFLLIMIICYSSVFAWDDEINRIKAMAGDILPANPIIIEAGAHDGGTTRALSAHFPSGSIYAFEAVPALFKRFEDNTQSCHNVHRFQLALSDTNGFTTFHISGGIGDQSSSLLRPTLHKQYHPAITFNKTIHVQTITLDDWAEQYGIDHIDFLWFDLQGAEYKALRTSPKMLKTIKVIWTEVNFVELYQGCALYKDFKQWLEEQGFTEIYKTREGYGYIGSVSVTSADALFVRKYRNNGIS